MTDPAKLIAGLRALVAHQPKSDRVWLVRDRRGRYQVTGDKGVRAAADWWMSWSVYCELAWQHDLTDVALEDPDSIALIAAVVAAYIPPALRRYPPRLPAVTPLTQGSQPTGGTRRGHSPHLRARGEVTTVTSMDPGSPGPDPAPSGPGLPVPDDPTPAEPDPAPDTGR